MCNISKLINFMCSDMEVRNKTIGVEVCSELVINILRRALIFFRIDFWSCEIKELVMDQSIFWKLLYPIIINLDIWMMKSWMVFPEVI